MNCFVLLGLAWPLAALNQQWNPFDQSLPCLTNRMVKVEPGDPLEFQLFNSRNTTCEVTMNFADPEFLPIALSVSPRNCAGDQIAQFNIPCSAPNGTVALQWQCIGQQAISCSLLNVTGGSGDFQRLQLETKDFPVNVRCQNGTSPFPLLQTFASNLPPPVTVPFISTSSSTCGSINGF